VANALYTSFRNGILGSHSTRVDLDADTIKFVMTDHGTDTPNTSTDDFYDDISAGTVGGKSNALASQTIGTVAAGVFDATDLVPAWSAVSGASTESISMIKDTGTNSTSDLCAYWDTGVTGLPFTPSGGDVNLLFNASGILQI
jgi:hypothetical protein